MFSNLMVVGRLRSWPTTPATMSSSLTASTTMFASCSAKMSATFRPSSTEKIVSEVPEPLVIRPLVRAPMEVKPADDSKLPSLLKKPTTKFIQRQMVDKRALSNHTVKETRLLPKKSPEFSSVANSFSPTSASTSTSDTYFYDRSVTRAS
ncbi:unnamed protein product, partial [Nesidiocoris tenuis]